MNMRLIKLTAIVLLWWLFSCTVQEEKIVASFQPEKTEFVWPISEINPDLPADWSEYNYLTFEITASSTQRFNLKLFDTEGVRRLQVHPYQGAWVRASIPLVHFQRRNVIGHDMAAIGKTALPGMCIGFSNAVGTIQNVEQLGLEMIRPIGSPVVEIRNVRLTMEPEDSILSPLPVVDRFGQWIPADWPDKARTEEELRKAWDEETNALRSDRFNFSKFGGFLDKQVKGTGYFRTEKIDGRWWFVDPEGYLFFSLGSTGIGPGGSYPRIEGREYLFEAFPPASHAGGDRRTGEASFSTWNLHLRFGENWYDQWVDHTFRRMDDWGLNTVANWSDGNLGRAQRKPYVATLRSWGFDPRTMGMPDVYDPGYAAMVDNLAREQCAHLKNDPYLLGYFVGNEPPWPGREQELVNVILSMEETPMQVALKKHLEQGDTPERRKEFVYATYVKFITMVNAAIKKHDPNHLNLGLRFGGSPPEEITRVSAQVGFDVFSINIYGYSTGNDRLNKIEELTGLPIIIGEFHFGVPGRGMAPGLAQTISQEERGAAYRYYVENAAAHPSMVGTHWFQWRDQPPTGRFDGENYNIGVVDVTDRPYPGLIDAMRETHGRLFKIKSGEIDPVSREAITH
jgi:hypothetical protein